jgi:MSHA biogenesis protein MshN
MKALTLRSNDAKALIGLGISLQALGKLDKAQEAFNRAQATATLSPELSLFVEQQLKQLNARSKSAQ